ncbi:hypothetical protein CRM22_010349 [Opisthorchis felineus]|uniref:Uncharacterized protein n=1 Tax=Opisthorchis felineus TaxID=147828 RepID=A0A4S2L0K3_OPIFE|nr:hypothetical protein CRM22_010349 [Opisthorchis felineus]
MLKSTGGIPDVLPMFAKSGRGSPGRINSCAASEDPPSTPNDLGSSSLVSNVQTSALTTAHIAGHPRGNRLGSGTQTPTHCASVKESAAYHHRPGVHYPTTHGASHYFAHPHHHRDALAHLPASAGMANQHISHHPTYVNLHSHQHNSTPRYHANSVVSSHGTSRSQLQDFMMNQWLQFKSQRNFATSENSRSPLPRTPTPTGTPCREDAATPPSPASTPTTQQFTPSADRGAISSQPSGSSTDHAGGSHSLPRRQPSHYYDGPAFVDNASVSWNHRRRGGPMGLAYRHPSSDASAWFRGQAVVRKTSSPTTPPNRGPGVFVQTRPASIVQSAPTFNNNNNSTSRAIDTPVAVNGVPSSGKVAVVLGQVLSTGGSPTPEKRKPSAVSEATEHTVVPDSSAVAVSGIIEVPKSQVKCEKETQITTRSETVNSNVSQDVLTTDKVTSDQSKPSLPSEATQSNTDQEYPSTPKQLRDNYDEVFSSNQLNAEEFLGRTLVDGDACLNRQIDLPEPKGSANGLMSVNVTSPPATGSKQRDRGESLGGC